MTALRCAKDLINIKHYSLQRVRQELRHRGIHDNDIEDAMQEFEDFDEQQAVQQLLEKKFAAALTEEKGRRRAFQALLRLGYDAGTVKSQMQRAMEQLEPDGEVAFNVFTVVALAVLAVLLYLLFRPDPNKKKAVEGKSVKAGA